MEAAITILAAAFFVANLADAGTTIYILKHGGQEWAPPMRWLIGRIGIHPAMFVKVAVGILIVGLVTAPWMAGWLSIALLSVAFVAYAAVVINNIGEMMD